MFAASLGSPTGKNLIRGTGNVKYSESVAILINEVRDTHTQLLRSSSNAKHVHHVCRLCEPYSLNPMVEEFLGSTMSEAWPGLGCMGFTKSHKPYDTEPAEWRHGTASQQDSAPASSHVMGKLLIAVQPSLHLDQGRGLLLYIPLVCRLVLQFAQQLLPGNPHCCLDG